MRDASTYRVARRNAGRATGDMAPSSHSPVVPEDIKVMPVPARPWLPKNERQKLLAHKRSNRRTGGVRPRGVNPLHFQHPFSGRAEAGEGKIVLAVDSTLRKLMRYARRKGDPKNAAVSAE